jgi:hypothetical protein
MMCRFLRWKGRYGAERYGDAALTASAAINDVPFSCLSTCQPWGPDDRPATPEGCGPERACHVPPRGGSGARTT